MMKGLALLEAVKIGAEKKKESKNKDALLGWFDRTRHGRRSSHRFSMQSGALN